MQAMRVREEEVSRSVISVLFESYSLTFPYIGDFSCLCGLLMFETGDGFVQLCTSECSSIRSLKAYLERYVLHT